MNVNNTEWLTSRDQICPVGEILVAWSVCLFCGISVHLSWLFVFVVVFVFAMTDYLRLFTRHHHYHYHYHHLPHQGCHPLIVSCHNVPVCSVGDFMRKLTGTILDNIWRKMRGSEQIHEKLKWPILFPSQIGFDLLKLRSLIAYQLRATLFYDPFYWLEDSIGGYIYPCMSRPFTWYRFMFMRSWHSSSSLC